MPSSPMCASEGSMVDRDKVESIIRHLRQYSAYLREIAELDLPEFLDDPLGSGQPHGVRGHSL